MTEIYLVRHAYLKYSEEQEATRGLSERGRTDALDVTKLLSKERIEAVCSSPYVRAVQTVEGIARLVGTSIDLDPRFREKIWVTMNLARRIVGRPSKKDLGSLSFPFPVENRTVTLNLEG